MEFCSPFDHYLATHGPPAIFLIDQERRWRFDASWTRDCYGRNEALTKVQPQYAVATDRANGFRFVLLTTNSRLLNDHPRLDFVFFSSLEKAQEELG